MSVGIHQLAGQAKATQLLSGALGSARLHHALLFEGPDGVGKFRAAMLLAQRLFCLRAPLPDSPAAACGECRACVKMQTAGHADVHVLSTEEKMIKVDALREATAALQVKPIEAPFKILIIRDADKMNPQAQNALLKTLEEPPGEAKVILTSSKPRSILLTVLSRCQAIPFRPVPADHIAEILVATKGTDPKVARLAAALSQGAPGRALEVDPVELTERRDQVAELDQKLISTVKGSVGLAIESAQALSEEGERLRPLLDIFSIWLRDQIIAASRADVELANQDRREDIEALVQARSLAEILRRARALEIARSLLDLPQNLNPLLIMEQFCLSLVGQPTSKNIPRL